MLHIQEPKWIAPVPGEFHTWQQLLVTGHMDVQTYPGRAQQASLVRVMENFIDPLCRHLGMPARITSGWRSKFVNIRIRGAKGSKHTKGQAVDFGFKGLSSFDIAALVVELGLDYDKLIAYHPEVGGHVHVSWVSETANRNRMLECFRDDDGDKAYRVYTP